MGFLCAVTTDEGKAYPGDDPLLLPRVRMSLGQTLEEFIYMVEPRLKKRAFSCFYSINIRTAY